jgi:hypothetical protein
MMDGCSRNFAFHDDLNALPRFLKSKGLGTFAAEPEMLHPTNRGFPVFIVGLEYEYPAFAKVVEWLAAFRVRAVVDHKNLQAG